MNNKTNAVVVVLLGLMIITSGCLGGGSGVDKSPAAETDNEGTETVDSESGTQSPVPVTNPEDTAESGSNTPAPTTVTVGANPTLEDIAAASRTSVQRFSSYEVSTEWRIESNSGTDLQGDISAIQAESTTYLLLNYNGGDISTTDLLQEVYTTNSRVYIRENEDSFYEERPISTRQIPSLSEFAGGYTAELISVPTSFPKPSTDQITVSEQGETTYNGMTVTEYSIEEYVGNKNDIDSVSGRVLVNSDGVAVLTELQVHLPSGNPLTYSSEITNFGSASTSEPDWTESAQEIG
jgi:hypothetical protein